MRYDLLFFFASLFVCSTVAFGFSPNAGVFTTRQLRSGAVMSLSEQNEDRDTKNEETAFKNMINGLKGLLGRVSMRSS